MIKFTKKALSLAIASFVTMTSVFGSNISASASTTNANNKTNEAVTASATTNASTVQTHLSATFTAPSDWSDNVYAYAYYTDPKVLENSKPKLQEPLDPWPGTKLKKSEDGTYQVSFESSIGSAKIIWINYDNTKNPQRFPADDGIEETEDGYTLVGNANFKPISVSFSAPTEWDNVYAYAYYTDAQKNLQEPLGYWPGTKLEKGANGKYDTTILSTTGEARFVFTNVNEGDTNESPIKYSNLKPNDIGGYYYAVSTKAQIPETDGDAKTENGYKVKEGQNNLSYDNVPTPGPISIVNPTETPTITPTKTPVVTVTPTAVVTVTPSAIPTVTPTAVVTVTPSAIPTVTPSAIPTVTPSAIPTVTPTVTPSVIPTVTPSAIPTVTPSAIPVVTPSAIPTVTPSAIPTVTPSAIPTVMPTVTPSAIPTYKPIETVVPTATAIVTPSAIPTATPGAIKDDPIPNPPVITNKTSTIKGSISFDKTQKTVGETIKVKVSAKSGKAPYKFTYYVKKGSKKVTLASNTKSKSVNWKPSKSGTYTVYVKITDAKKKTKTISKKYTVKPAVITIKSFKTSKASGQKIKTKIVISANATVKKGKASYKFAVKLGKGKVKTLKGYSSTKKVTWRPTKKGTYTLYLYVKNGKGITISKTKTFKIK